MAQQIYQQLGKYRIIKFLGRGGFAEVYLGEHVYLKTQAAIKVLHTRVADGDVEMFRSEALTIAHLAHPHIIRVLDFDIEQAVPFLIMEYAPYGNLRQRHPAGTRVPPAAFLSYVRQVASALQYAHDHKLIHRDVKPENMLVGSDNKILLSDFGTALVAQNTQTQSTQDTVIGTLSYMAPEQIQGKARPASDQYALAVVAYEWISGRKPFTGSYMEIVAQHLSTPPPALDEQALAIPHSVQLVLRRALAKDPHQRFPRVQDFAEELERAFQARPVNGASPQRTEQAPRGRGQAYNGQGQPSPVLPPPQLVVGKPPVAPHGRGQAHAPLAVPPSQPIKTSGRMLKKGLKLGLGTLAIIVVLGALLLCGLGFAAFHFFLSPATTTVTNQAGATALANDFVQAIASQNYGRAYNDLGPSLTSQTSRTQFTQQAQSEDRCYGVVTAYTSAGTATQGNSLIYYYTMARARLQQPYQLHVTLQQDTSGNWQISDYGSNVSSASQCA